jgi:fucose 4-O-acetylase-like acetyltransferase
VQRSLRSVVRLDLGGAASSVTRVTRGTGHRALDEMVARTPESRDRYVDFLRALSILAVVFGHWFIALILWNRGVIVVYSAIGVTSGLWLATWVFQVIPLFFFVGGFSNATSFEAAKRRGTSTAAFLRSRAQRLLRPTLVFLVAWVAIEVALHLLDRGGTGLVRGIRLGNTLPFGPLWFLAVYFGIVLLSPLTLAAHRRFGIWIPVVLVAVSVLVDVLAFAGGVHGIRWVNLAVIWSLPHQLGYFYADGRLVRAGRRVHAAMAIGGLACLIGFTSLGVYPRSMLGTDATFFNLKAIERVSNMNPPTLCIAALTFWLIGLAMLVRDPITRWLQRPVVWKPVIAVNAVIMTLFVWHMTAYAVAIVLLYPHGFGRALDSTARWWSERPLWEVLPGIILFAVVAVLGRFERPARVKQPASS